MVSLRDMMDAMPEATEVISWAVAAFAAMSFLRLSDWAVARVRATTRRFREWRWSRAWEANRDGWPS